MQDTLPDGPGGTRPVGRRRYLVAGILGDDLRFGVFGLALMLTLAAVMLLVGRRSETVAGLLDRGDERIRGIDNDATLFAGVVLRLRR
jgi:hypothetical protein